MSVFLSSTSKLDCQGWGDTIWERCWWINNVKWVTGFVFIAIWFGPLYLVFKRFPDSLLSSLFGWLWMFVGGVIALVVSLMIVDPLLIAILD
ncbi:MAG: hypothetical protein RIR69_1608 [Actinomycetota bacterium]|jgi:hypothetical protein